MPQRADESASRRRRTFAKFASPTKWAALKPVPAQQAVAQRGERGQQHEAAVEQHARASERVTIRRFASRSLLPHGRLLPICRGRPQRPAGVTVIAGGLVNLGVFTNGVRARFQSR